MYYACGMYLHKGSFQKAYEFFENAINIDPKGYVFLFEVFPEAKENQNILELIDLNKK